MIKNFIAALLVLFSNVGISQGVSAQFQKGERLQFDDLGFRYIVGSVSNGFYTMGVDPNSIKFKQYLLFHESVSGKVLSKYEFPFDESFKKSTAVEWTYIDNDRVHVIFSVEIPERKKRVVYKSTLTEGGEFSEPEELVAFDPKGSIGLGRSKDKSKTMFFINPEYKGMKDEKFQINVIDDKGRKLWAGEVKLPVRDKNFVFTDYRISNEGDVFVMGYSTPDWTKGEKAKYKGPNRDYVIFKITREREEVEVYKLPISEKFISSINMMVDFKDGALGVVGLYSESNHGLSRGYFVVTIDQNNGRISNPVITPYERDLMVKYVDEKKIDKGWELWNFTLRNFIHQADGGAIFVTEKSYHKTKKDESGGTYTNYYKEDILVFKCDKNGDMVWNTVIPKRQMTSSRKGETTSFLLKKGDDEDLHFVFNDHHKNLDDRVEGNNEAIYKREVQRYKKAFLVVATIDKNGGLSYEKILDSEEEELVIYPRAKYSDYLGNGEILMYGRYKSECQFGTLKL